MDPQEIARNIETFSQKYNLNIDSVSDNIVEDDDEKFEEGEIIQSSDAEKIILIKFSGKIKIEDTIDLYKLGVTSYSQISKNTILAKVEVENIEKLKSYPFINNIREYKPEDKIKKKDLDVLNQLNILTKVYITPLGKGENNHIQDLQQIGVRKITYDDTARIYSAEILPSKINSILNLKWVKKVDIQREKKLEAIGLGFAPEDSRILVNAPLVWPSYTGANINVGVYDSGIWDQHPDFAGAVIHPDPDEDGHGTHVSGIIASRGTRDIEGNYDGRGVAYGSGLYVLDLGTAITDAFDEFEDNSINIVSNSWGNGPNYDYGPDAEIADSYVENNGLTLIFSAGNLGSLAHTINDPKTAKNIITVGAISYTIGGDSGGIGQVAHYSSRGPTRTSNRLKPDVVAPGGDTVDWGTLDWYYKYGVVSTNAQNGTGNWLDDADDRWPTDSNYTRMAGTSMAAPHVSGAVALINEAYEDSFSGLLADGIQPRDFKALLIANAIPLKGYGTDPNNGYANTDVGYGLIDAYFSIFDREGEKETLVWGHGGVIETVSNTQDWDITTNGNEQKLTVVLAYEDNEGQIDDTHVLKDDLDLRITSPNGNEFTYTLPAGVTAEGPAEKIVIDDPSDYGTGSWTIRVEGASWDNWLNPFEAQRYTVIAIADYVEPSLGAIEVPSDVIVVEPGAAFTLSPTIRNNGGLTAAGVTAKVSTSAAGFGGDINKEAFVGNIVGTDAVKSVSFDITAPSTPGTYNLYITAKGINHDLNEPPRKTVTVYVGLSPPDYFGYTYIDSNTQGGPTYEWIDITSTGTRILPDSDDLYVDGLPVGFFFNFYGQDYSQVSITNNGLILPIGGTYQWQNQPIGSSTPHNFIAPFWDDLVTWGSADAIYYQTIGEAPNRKFVIEWYDNQHYTSSSSGVTFEAILYEGSNNIKYQYKDTNYGSVYWSVDGDSAYNNGASATVGIEGLDGRGLQYSYKQSVITPDLAILFKYPQYAGTNLYLSKQAPVSKDHGSTMTYTLHYHNLGDTAAHNVVLEDTLPAEVVFESASDGGSYDSNTRRVTWNLGSVDPSGHGYRTITVEIPQSVPVGTVIQNDATISTSDLEVRYDDNEAVAQTRVTGSNLPPDVGVEPNNGGTTPSIYWGNPITFSYHSCDDATGVDIRIHINDGGSDITGSMSGGPPDWTYTAEPFYPRHGRATITYTVYGCDVDTVSFDIYIDPAGYIYDVETDERIAGATVWLQWWPEGAGEWENVPIGQTPAIMQPDVNPQVTGEDGWYQWDVLGGSYRVHVEADGYYPEDSIVVSIPPAVTDLHVGLTRIPSENEPPVATDDSATTLEDTAVTIDVIVNDYDVDGNLDPTTANTDCTTCSVPAHGTLTNHNDGTFTYTPDPDYYGPDGFTYEICDTEGLCDTATVTIDVTAVNDAPVISVDVSEQAVQYSDGIANIAISATDIDSSSLTISTSWTKDGIDVQPDLPPALVLSAGECILDSLPATWVWILEEQALVDAGTYDVTFTISDGEDEIEAYTTLVVEPEDAAVAFDDTNPVAVQVAEPGGNSEAFSLTVDVTEAMPDISGSLLAYPGDISLAEVSVSLVPVGPGSPAEPTSCSLEVVGTGYDAILTVTCEFNDVAVNTYAVQVTIDGGYYISSGEDVVVIYDSSLGFTTGGGTFLWPGTEDKTNFGYTMKYNKKATNIKGNLLLVRHLQDGTIYRVKSNALYGLALGEFEDDDETYGWASFSGKATYLEPGWPEPIGNHEFITYVEDHGEPGKNIDRIWIKVMNQGNTIDVMSMDDPGANNAVEINGGNIVVPHQ